ncbi:MazG-like family protein [Enterococcus sp. AZ102]|uniref:MazG-like family protein n=1 Tax=Enterococcus sp. AZ102 TaxID=2774865 RepID=UPI003F270B94
MELFNKKEFVQFINSAQQIAESYSDDFDWMEDSETLLQQYKDTVDMMRTMYLALTMDELKPKETTELIKQWFYDRKLNDADPFRQLAKLQEESGELAAGIIRKNDLKTKDSIGDITVVLIGICTQLDIDYKECVEMAYNEIKDRKGELIDGVFVKEEDLK